MFSLPLVRFDWAIAGDGAERRLVGVATSVDLAVRAVSLWSDGALLARGPVGADGAFDIPCPDAARLHAWLDCDAGADVYGGPVDSAPPVRADAGVSISVTAPVGHAGGVIDVSAEGAANLFLNGRSSTLAPDGRRLQGHLDGWPSLLVVEAVAGDGRWARRPAWNWENAAFHHVRKAIKRDRKVRVDGGPPLRPVRTLPEAAGWRFHFSADGAASSMLERDIGVIETLPEVAPPQPADVALRKSLNERSPIDAASWAALARPVVLPGGPDARAPTRRRPRVVLVTPEPLPTSEIYVIEPLRALVRDRMVDLVRIENAEEADPSAIADGDVVIVVRYVAPRWLERIAAMKPNVTVVYVVDDDLTAAIGATGLPDEYRRRMVDTALWDFQAMLRLADRLVVSSARLAERLTSPKTRLLTPPWIRREATLAHHRRDRPIRVAYHGGDAHSDDLAMIVPALAALVGANPDVELQIFSGTRVADALRGLPRVEVLRPLPWEAYKTFARRNPCHVALAPVLDTPFNASKSYIKFCDAASLGAVGVYSDLSPYREIVTDGEDGFLVPNSPEAWGAKLAALVADRDLIERAAEACRDAATRLCALDEATAFWRRLILDEGGATLPPRAGPLRSVFRRLIGGG